MSRTKKKCKVCVYIRGTSSRREAALSLEVQSEECVRLAVSLGYQVDPECVHREIGSGATLDRSQLAKLRRMAAAGGLDALIVYSPNRLSRDPVDLLALLREFGEHGVEVHFVHGSSDPTPESGPLIVSEAMFQKVQGRFRENEAYQHLLTGFAKCGLCGASMAVHAGTGKSRYYRCIGASRVLAHGDAGLGGCLPRVINGAWLEDQVWSRVVAMVRDPSGVIADLELNCRTRAGELGQEIERLRGEVQKVEQQEMRLLDLCRGGTVRLELLVARMEGSSTLLADLRARLAELDEQREREENALAARERIREYCLTVSEGLEELDSACKRELMMRLVVKVVVAEGDVMVTAEIDLELW